MGLLRERRKWLDGICVSGGEPCLHEGLEGFLGKVKEEDLLVKLDTNGSRPEVLERLVREGLVDYVAMDVKAPAERYPEIAGVEVNVKDIKRSAEIIMNSGVDHEFRTTVVPRLISERDIEGIGKWLEGARRFFVQQFRPDVTLDKEFSKEEPYSEKRLEELAGVARRFFREVGVRS
jgi:pyruvate formate lyase activating enzyme